MTKGSENVFFGTWLFSYMAVSLEFRKTMTKHVVGDELRLSCIIARHYNAYWPVVDKCFKHLSVYYFLICRNSGDNEEV